MQDDSASSGHGVTWLEGRDGRVCVELLAGGCRRLVAHPNPGTYVSRAECVTAYPLALIELILQVKSIGYLCQDIQRDEDPDFVELFLRCSMLGYRPLEAFRGARILDFGSGSGASTVVLARMFPEAEIVGVDLEADLIAVAEKRAEHYGLSKVRFVESPDPERLPGGLGTFDYINLAAVYEHLLPAERPRLLTQLWSVLRIGGVIFVNQLPYRFYPVEAHTTGLPLINFLPDRLAHFAAKRFSPRVSSDASWSALLRDGIRGGTAAAVRRDIQDGGGHALTLTPTQMGLRDHADLWFTYSSARGPHPAKRVMRATFKALGRLTGNPVAPGLSLAFEKRA